MLSSRWALNIYIALVTVSKNICCDFANPQIFSSGRKVLSAQKVERNAYDDAGITSGEIESGSPWVKSSSEAQIEDRAKYHEAFHNQFGASFTTEKDKDLSRGYSTTDNILSENSEHLSVDSQNNTVSCQQPCGGDIEEYEDTEVVLIRIPSWFDFLNHTHTALTESIVRGWIIPVKELYSDLQKQDTSIFGESRNIKVEESASFTLDMGNTLKHLPTIDPTGASNSGHNSTLSLMKLERSIFVQVSSDSLMLIVLCVIALATLVVTSICIYHKKFNKLHKHVTGQMQRFDTVDDHECHRA